MQGQRHYTIDAVEEPRWLQFGGYNLAKGEGYVGAVAILQGIYGIGMFGVRLVVDLRRTTLHISNTPKQAGCRIVQRVVNIPSARHGEVARGAEHPLVNA